MNIEWVEKIKKEGSLLRAGSRLPSESIYIKLTSHMEKIKIPVYNASFFSTHSKINKIGKEITC
jgi:hypothetical protein